MRPTHAVQQFQGIRKETNPIMKHAYRHRYPFQSHFVPINGHRYHYVDEGQGAPVVMLHGNPTWSFYYRQLIAALAPDYRVLAPDHIGCGLSDKPSRDAYAYRLEDRVRDLETFIDQVLPEAPLTLVVHDWGGMIGMAFALRHLDRIRRVVITNTSGFLPPAGKPIPLRLRLIRNFKTFAEPAVLGLNLFARAALVMCARRPLPRDVRRALVAPYDRPKNRIATLRFVQDIPLEPTDPSYALVRFVDDNLHRLQHLPMLICWGKHDFVFDLDYFHEWQRRFPDAEAHLFETAGHYLLEDEPWAVTRTIQNFLDRHPIE